LKSNMPWQRGPSWKYSFLGWPTSVRSNFDYLRPNQPGIPSARLNVPMSTENLGKSEGCKFLAAFLVAGNPMTGLFPFQAHQEPPVFSPIFKNNLFARVKYLAIFCLSCLFPIPNPCAPCLSHGRAAKKPIGVIERASIDQKHPVSLSLNSSGLNLYS